MARRLRVVPIRKGKVAADSQFIETLVWVLDRARRGEIKAYALALLTEEEDKTRHTIETACPLDDSYRLRLLGMIRLMERRVIKDEFNDGL